MSGVRPIGWFALLAVIIPCPLPALAERLPFTTYTTRQGLASDSVSAAAEDAQGFLWLATGAGLSRFDGLGFRTFGRNRGLEKRNITSLVIDKDGIIWVGIWGAGVYRFDPAGGGSFTEVPVEGRTREWEAVLLALDKTGRVWCAFDGVYRVETSKAGSPVLRRVPVGPDVSLPFASALLADRAGNLWVGSRDLYAFLPDGRVIRVETSPPFPPATEITVLAEDVAGHIWVATTTGLWRMDSCDIAGPQSRCLLRPVLDVVVRRWNGLLQRVAGGVWVGTESGLLEIDGEGRIVRRITREQGLISYPCWPLLVDRTGDLWLATDGNGIQRLAVEGFTSFGIAEGLEATAVASMFLTLRGDIVVVGVPQVLQSYDGRRFVAVRPVTPPGNSEPSWGWYQVDMQDHRGEWWIPKASGVLRLPPVRSLEELARVRPVAFYRESGCFRGWGVFRLYEDTRGDVWIGTIERDHQSTYRWRRASGEFDCYPSKSIMGAPAAPTAFLDDGQDTLWIGFDRGQIARFRDGRIRCVFGCEDDGAHGNVTSLFLDRRGRLWITTARAGVLRVDDPGADRPLAVRLTTEQGLSSEETRAVVEDRFGRIYVGTERGVDVLDEAASPIRHYGTNDGLPHPFVNAALADPAGNLWFGTLNGLARFTPATRQRDTLPPRVLIDAVRISGIARPVSATGERQIAGLLLAPDQHDVAVDFVGLPRATAETLRFEYRLAAGEAWSPPSNDHSLVLAGLSAGDYRLEIRALDAAGAPSLQTAVVSLRVLAPVHRRPWFLGLAALAALSLAVAAYRARVGRLLALERQRTRIAMDLHDEMGSALGSVGLLADLAADDSLDPQRRKGLLDQIAESASGIQSSLTDIVWSLRRVETTVEGLAQHLSGHSRRLFPGPEPTLDIRFPDNWPKVEMSLAARRNVLLIGLEALHNAARHSGARLVGLELRPEGRRWRLVVSDDGKGIHKSAPESAGGGFGLETMRRRASGIGAALEIESSPGRGTTVTLLFDPRAEEQSHMNIRETWNRIRRM